MRMLSLVLLIGWVLAVRADETAAPPNAVPGKPDLWFPVGETLTYDIHWGLFHVGQTVVTTEWTNRGSRALLLIRFKTRTNRVVEKIYPVDDLIEALIEPNTFLPIYFKKQLSEGRYRCDEITVFDYKRMEMKWKSNLSGRNKRLPIEPDTRDLVSMMYWLRRTPFVTGATNEYRVMADEKTYDLMLRVGSREKLKLPKWGTIRAFRVDPTAAFNGLFVRKGKMTFWVSDDPRQVCVRIMAEVPVANIRLTLVDVKGPGDDFWVKATPSKTKDDDDAD